MVEYTIIEQNKTYDNLTASEARRHLSVDRDELKWAINHGVLSNNNNKEYRVCSYNNEVVIVEYPSEFPI